MLIFGHRGAAGYAPENTLPSIRRALEIGVDGVEFDVRVTRDRHPVLIHDATVDRTTSATGSVAELSLLELRSLLVTEPNQLPTLDEAIATVRAAARINVEIKHIDAVRPTLQVLTRAVASGVVDPNGLLMTSFEHGALAQARAEWNDLPVGLLTSGMPDERFWQLADKLDVDTVNIDIESIRGPFVDRANGLGLLVMVYTVNSPDDARRMHELGVDAIFSDFPDRVRS